MPTETEAKQEQATKEGDLDLTPPYLRYLVRLIRPFPDFDFFFVKGLRQRAVQKLGLKPGDRVLDVGCGPGGSFPYLVDAVAQSGQVVGVEISPQAVINAQQRIRKHGWTNVHVLTADAQNAPPRLTQREVEILTLASHGCSYTEIAGHLVLATATVKTHLRHCYSKLGVPDKAAAVATALRHGLIE